MNEIQQRASYKVSINKKESIINVQLVTFIAFGEYFTCPPIYNYILEERLKSY